MAEWCSLPTPSSWPAIPPSPLSPSLSRAIATLTCLFARHLQASRTYARARCTPPPPPLNSLSHSLRPSVRPRPPSVRLSVQAHSTLLTPSLARSLSVVVVVGDRTDAEAPRPWQSRNCGARRRRGPREGLRAGKEGEEEGEGGRGRDAEAGRWRTATQGTQGARRK